MCSCCTLHRVDRVTSLRHIGLQAHGHTRRGVCAALPHGFVLLELPYVGWQLSAGGLAAECRWLGSRAQPWGLNISPFLPKSRAGTTLGCTAYQLPFHICNISPHISHIYPLWVPGLRTSLRHLATFPPTSGTSPPHGVTTPWTSGPSARGAECCAGCPVVQCSAWPTACTRRGTNTNIYTNFQVLQQFPQAAAVYKGPAPTR